MDRLRRVVWVIILAAGAAMGCHEELETGYKPRTLNASSTDRRAYYAPAFTPEATPDDNKGATNPGFHKPTEY